MATKKEQTIYVGKNKNGNRVVFVPTKKKSVKYVFYKVDGGKTHVKKTVRTVLKGSALKNLFKGAKVEQLKRK